MLQSALDVALCVVRANPTVVEGLGAHLEGNIMVLAVLISWYSVHYQVGGLMHVQVVIH